MSAPRPTKLAQACAHAHGFGLVEVLLVLGGLGHIRRAWLVFGPASVAADVKQTQMDFSETATAIDRSLGIVGGSGLSTSLVRTDGLAAQRLRQGEALRNGAVRCRSWRTRFDAGTIRSWSRPATCPGRLRQAGCSDGRRPGCLGCSGQRESVGNKYDPATAAAACQTNGGDRMGFVYFSGLASGSSVAVSAIALPPAPVGVPRPTQPRQSPRSMGPQRRQCRAWNAWRGDAWHPWHRRRPCLPAAGPGDPDDSPANASGFAPDTPPDVKACAVPPTQTQNVTCPAGQIGTVTQQRIGYCGAPTGPVYAADGTLVYESWGVAGYLPAVTTSNTCAPACIAPASSAVAITRSAPVESQNVGCPAGQTGSTCNSAAASRTARAPRPGPARRPPGPRCRARRIAGAHLHGHQRVGNHVQHLRHSGAGGYVGIRQSVCGQCLRNRGQPHVDRSHELDLSGRPGSEWSSSWGPVRGNGSIEITYNGATATVAGGVTAAAPRALEARHHSRQATKSSASTASAWSSSSVATPRPTMAQSYAVAWRSTTAFCPDASPHCGASSWLDFGLFGFRQLPGVRTKWPRFRSVPLPSW